MVLVLDVLVSNCMRSICPLCILRGTLSVPVPMGVHTKNYAGVHTLFGLVVVECLSISPIHKSRLVLGLRPANEIRRYNDVSH